MAVRPARPDDVPRLSTFVIQAWKEAGPDALGFTGATDEAIKEIASEEFLEKMLSSPRILMVVAEEDGKIIGFSSVRRVKEREAELSGIIVLESATGRGVGTKLLRKAVGAAKRRGYFSMLVKTEVANERAIRFYRRAGFTESGKVVEKVGRTKVALRLMVKRLG
ncbi:MAG: GNAT family N-acetyltransferase [Nitrososphaerales archaeon]